MGPVDSGYRGARMGLEAQTLRNPVHRHGIPPRLAGPMDEVSTWNAERASFKILKSVSR